jgi:hypothetical protein
MYYGSARSSSHFFSVSLFLLSIASFTSAQKAANVWVDTNGGTCTRQSTLGAYVDEQACSSMQAALTAALAGDTIVLKSGTYAAQSITSGQKASTVNFVAESSGQVLVGYLHIVGVDKIHVTGVIASGTGDSRGGLEITEGKKEFTDLVIDGFAGSYAGISASNVTVKNSEFGNANVCNMPNPADIEDGFRFWGRPNGTTAHNDKLLNSVIHDWRGPNGCGSLALHVDGMQLQGGDGIVIDGNRFYNNETSDIQQGIWGNVTLGSMLVQNNFFGAPYTWGNVLSIGQAPCAGAVIQNNVFASDASSVNNSGGCIGGGPTQRSNVYLGPVTNCDVGSTFSGDHNIFPRSGGTACGRNAKRCTVQWLNGAPSSSNGYDMHVSSSDTCTKDAANPSTYPPADFYGTARPQGRAPDAGAFEIPVL